ncbi:hypothetical protein [Citricoccus sp. GCM10030269]|uniref:hypothetical protein n=1 Tax=Citricoccus sp. GCM10030269 TaxID=3273388 RepID=UPI003610788A
MTSDSVGFPRPWVLPTWIAGAFLIGVAAGLLTHSAWPISLHALTSWGYAFSTSAGLGGMAALGAAAIAYRGVTRSADTSRETSLEAQWWENARWSVDRLLSVSDLAVEVDNASTEDEVNDDDSNVNLLRDQDAYAAIIMLEYLGENAPSEKARLFALDALGVVLGVPSGVDNEEGESAVDIADTQPNGTAHGQADV